MEMGKIMSTFQCGISYFLTKISTPPNPLAHVTPRRLCSGRLRPGSASAQVCSGLLTHLTRNRQLLTRSPKRIPFPARGPKYVPTIHSFPDSYHAGLAIFMHGTFFCVLLQGCFTLSSAFCLGLCIINDHFPLALR
jgi:hypothetical protein